MAQSNQIRIVAIFWLLHTNCASFHTPVKKCTQKNYKNYIHKTAK